MNKAPKVDDFVDAVPGTHVFLHAKGTPTGVGVIKYVMCRYIKLEDGSRWTRSTGLPYGTLGRSVARACTVVEHADYAERLRLAEVVRRKLARLPRLFLAQVAAELSADDEATP